MPTAKTIVEGLALLGFEERLMLTDEDRARGAKAAEQGRGYFRKYPTIIPEIPPDGSPQEEFDAVIMNHNATTLEVVPLGWLAFLSDDAAKTMLKRLFAQTWDPKADDAAYVFDRFGLEMFTPLLENGKNDPGYADAYKRYAAVNCAVVESPREAALLLEMSLKPKGKEVKEALSKYMERFPEASVIGMLPIVLAKATQKKALPVFAKLIEGDREKLVLDVAKRYGEAALAATRLLIENARAT